MVAFYKHDIPAWMDGTEGLSDGTYRVYHVICQLIYLNEGPIMLNERGIAGRCNQSMKTFRKHLDELLALGKLSMVDGRIANARAAVELESVQKNRENAGKGGRNSGKSRENPQENSGNSGNSSGNAEREPDKSLKNNDAGEAALKTDRSLKEKKREEKTREEQHSVEVSETSARKPMLDDRTLEAALREAAGMVDDPSPNLFVVGPVHALIGEGYDLERHILPVVRSLKAQGKRWSNWRYIVPAVREQNAAPAAPDKAQAAAPVDEAKIRRGMISMAKGYVLDDRWSDSWGPRRGEAGCRIPEEIWREAEQIIQAEKAALEEALRGKSNGVVAHH
jgi:uncharacterized protein YdaU (DUF1376 family)